MFNDIIKAIGIEPYYQDNNVAIFNGDCKEILPLLSNIDAIVTDPPYELGFMGKSWDSTGIAYDLKIWQGCINALKSGGHLLAFGGTRTYHRMACAIEDAGFEIRDMIEWVYGSGFPKSLNIGKAIDKIQGNERYVVGDNPNDRSSHGKNAISMCNSVDGKLTKGNTEWEGWGTALKPAHESCCLAQKPCSAVPIYDIMMVVLNSIGEQICQLPSFVRTVKSHSELNQSVLVEDVNIAQWIADGNISIEDILSVLMATLQSELVINTNWNIVLLWLNTLKDLYLMKSKYTTLTETGLIIDLKILQSLQWRDIFQSIIQAPNKQIGGMIADVLTATNLFNAVQLKLDYIRTHFVQENVTFREELNGLRPNHEPICMARKPIKGTVADNVLKYGTGGINIDGCRVDINENDLDVIKHKNGNGIKSNGGFFGKPKDYRKDTPSSGRFPANLIHDGSEEVLEIFPNGGNGSAARFFYCAKASKSERNAGCEELSNEKFVAGNYSQSPVCKTCNLTLNGTNNHSGCSGEVYYREMASQHTCNNHPTVKPLALMEYLIKLITPPKGIVLDPFMGSGSTLIAARKLGYKAIGVELNKEYADIAVKRLAQGVLL